MNRTIATHLSVLIVGMALGLGAVAVAGPTSGSSAAADSRTVRELQKLNATNTLLLKQLGGYSNIAVTPSIQDLLENVDRDVAKSCRALAERSYDCPLP